MPHASPSVIVLEYSFATIPPCHDVVKRSRIFKTNAAGHAPISTATPRAWKCRLTPFLMVPEANIKQRQM
jgi:hypothetical protein